MESVRVAAPRDGTLASSRHFTLRDSFLVSDSAAASATAGGVSSLAGLTLAAVLSNERGSSPAVRDHPRRPHTSSNHHIVRTLLDIIRSEEASTNPSTSFVRKRTWRSFKDRLRLRRFNTGVPVPQSSGMEAPARSRMMRVSRERVEGEDDRGLEEEEVTGDVGDPDGGEVGGEGDAEPVAEQPAQQAVRMSLMDLLEETDRQTHEEEEEDNDIKGGGRRGGRGLAKVEHSCCVCMVRHKGAAFIPCGHTFCRICSRELWVQRGNCPLCNGFILEILDIF